jgi:hypothetical protein
MMNVDGDQLRSDGDVRDILMERLQEVSGPWQRNHKQENVALDRKASIEIDGSLFHRTDGSSALENRMVTLEREVIVLKKICNDTQLFVTNKYSSNGSSAFDENVSQHMTNKQTFVDKLQKEMQYFKADHEDMQRKYDNNVRKVEDLIGRMKCDSTTLNAELDIYKTPNCESRPHLCSAINQTKCEEVIRDLKRLHNETVVALRRQFEQLMNSEERTIQKEKEESKSEVADLRRQLFQIVERNKELCDSQNKNAEIIESYKKLSEENEGLKQTILKLTDSNKELQHCCPCSLPKLNKHNQEQAHQRTNVEEKLRIDETIVRLNEEVKVRNPEVEVIERKMNDITERNNILYPGLLKQNSEMCSLKCNETQLAVSTSYFRGPEMIF